MPFAVGNRASSAVLVGAGAEGMTLQLHALRIHARRGSHVASREGRLTELVRPALLMRMLSRVLISLMSVVYSLASWACEGNSRNITTKSLQTGYQC